MGSLKVYFWNFIHGYSLSYPRLSYICHQRNPSFMHLYDLMASYTRVSSFCTADFPPTFTPKIKPYNPSSPFLWQKYKYISWKNRPLFPQYHNFLWPIHHLLYWFCSEQKALCFIGQEFLGITFGCFLPFSIWLDFFSLAFCPLCWHHPPRSKVLQEWKFTAGRFWWAWLGY